MFPLFLDAAAAAPAQAAGTFSSIILIIAMFAIFYFVVLMPENKKKKKAEEMRNSLNNGDEITTIGGIIGKVVQVTEDTITIESGEDRVRIQLKKWAVSTTAKMEAEEAAKAQSRFKKKSN